MTDFFPVRRRSWRGYGLILAAMASLAPLAASAAVTDKDVQVAGRVLGFMNPPVTGSVKVGIVYDPSNAASAADEKALLGIMGSGLQVAGVNLVPVPVPVSNASGAQVGVFFLTSGLGGAAAQVGDVAASKKILCITTDLTATQSGACAVAVQVDPKVQITVNKATLAKSGLSFSSAFMLMITEI